MEMTMNKPEPTGPIRRVGSFTLGLCLIATGIFFLFYHFVPNFDWLLALKIAPSVGLILLGIEVLYFASRPERWKYDFLSVFFCMILMCCCFGVATIPVIAEQTKEAERYSRQESVWEDPQLRAELDSASSEELDEENETDSGKTGLLRNKTE